MKSKPRQLEAYFETEQNSFNKIERPSTEETFFLKKKIQPARTRFGCYSKQEG